MDKKYTLYADDVKFAEGLTLNGSNYVSKTEVDVSNLPHVFKFTVKDSEGNITEEYEHAKLLQQVQYAWDDNKFYLAFAPVSEQEIKNAEFQSNLEYMAMMMDLDIDS
jgi:hypothetical protein